MKTLTLYLKITTFLLLIWMYQCFFNRHSYISLIDKNILQTKNELKYERVLTEGDISGKKQTYAKECIEENPLDNKKSKCGNPVQYKDPYDQWNNVIIPKLWERFDKETSGMDPKLKERKWNVEFNKISITKVRDLYSIPRRCDIPDEEKEKIIDRIMEELRSDFEKFLCKCKEDQGKNETKNNKKKFWKFFIN
ncbi:fam-g protein [Plasmodium gallinaceum]|uniref:Fam-g protein n=1 Tax=Plasmodium gallinaceum TaxID=5849 RepID=A0A1J1H3C6_PLAGA|nr:fam-g protein [Plasmodium gallinaceum]CRG97991.1 fam-g protein [Plasmodium gallinaceum]